MQRKKKKEKKIEKRKYEKNWKIENILKILLKMRLKPIIVLSNKNKPYKQW